MLSGGTHQERLPNVNARSGQGSAYMSHIQSEPTPGNIAPTSFAKGSEVGRGAGSGQRDRGQIAGRETHKSARPDRVESTNS